MGLRPKLARDQTALNNTKKQKKPTYRKTILDNQLCRLGAEATARMARRAKKATRAKRLKISPVLTARSKYNIPLFVSLSARFIYTIA